MMQSVPTNLLTGFLGVGKTTAVIDLLQRKEKGSRWAVLVNEYGAVSIDDVLIEGSSPAEGVTVKEVGGGCVCCASAPFLPVAIHFLLLEARPERLIIETTGLGHPARLIDSLRMSYHGRLDVRATIGIVDPHDFAKPEMRDNPIFIDQIQMADVLVMNKLDTATPELVTDFQGWANGLFPPKLLIAGTTHGRLDPAWLDLSATDERLPLYPQESRPTPHPSLQGGGRGVGQSDEEPKPVRTSPEDLIFLKPLFLAELGVARSIKALAKGPHPLPKVNVDSAVAWVEQKMGIAFAASQRAAIKAAVTNKLMVVTGGPGTGKTTIVRAIIEMFLAKSLKVLLTAPTGRAAKRLSESTGREAKTIHRLLEFNPQERQFTRNAEDPLDVDLLVVDETSMVDVVLMNRLLQAVPPFACVVLVGDVDQLPSVGPGAVLTDLIESKEVPVARLTEVHRQAESSWIVRAAHAINSGLEPMSAPPGGDGDFYFVEASEPEAIMERVVQMVRDRIPAKFGLNSFRDVQVLCPQLGRSLGVEAMNNALQEALNPARPGVAEVKRFASAWRVGDKVMQVQNNYDREVFNGDIGRIDAIDNDEQMLVVDFDGRPVEYEFSDLDELQLSYACTIHKSQGSEYPAVVIPVHTQHFVMLQRNLIYTGLTRGRKLVALVGSRKALWIAVNTADTKKRFSLLKWRIKPTE